MSQADQIRKHLMAGKAITPLQALSKFNCMRLGARIYDLTRRGMKIESKLVADNKTGKRYARYRLMKTTQAT